MRFMRLGAAAGAVLLLAGQAEAAPEFDIFQEMCVAHRADPVAALRAAQGKGWMPIPAKLLESFPKQFTSGDGLMRTDRRSMYMLFAGAMEQESERDPFKMRFCAVATMPGDSATLKKQVADWVGVPASKDFSRGDEVGYTYVEENGVRRAVDRPGDDEARALLLKGGLNMIFIGAGKDDMSMVMLAAPSP